MTRNRWLPAPGRALPGLVLMAALVYTGIEAAVAGPDAVGLVWLLRWRLVPALLWVAATPLFVREGARWPGPARDPARILVWAGVFVLWHAAVNLFIRLPDAPARGASWLVTDALEGAVDHAPAALLLFVLLVVAGYGASQGEPARATARGPDGGSTRDHGMRGAVPRKPLIFNGGDRTHVVPPGLIRWLEAEGDYVRVHATDRSFLVRASMTSLEQTLRAAGRFVRIHRSTLVGETYVRELRPLGHGDYAAVLDDGTELRVPRTRREALRRLRYGG